MSPTDTTTDPRALVDAARLAALAPGAARAVKDAAFIAYSRYMRGMWPEAARHARRALAAA